MFGLRKLHALVLGPPADTDPLCDQLRTSDVPVSGADCRSCSDPCDLGHEGYPARFNIDTSSHMLGSVKPYHRQIVISTGKSDWDRDIADEKGSLAAHMLSLSSDKDKDKDKGKDKDKEKEKEKDKSPHQNHKPVRPVNGLFRTSDSTKTSVLNGSHISISDNHDHESILVFPDYTVVSEVRRSPQGAQDLWSNSVNPHLNREGGAMIEKSSLKTWVLPYSCVILLCSHKRRDNRCGIAAPKLEHAFIQSLAGQGWHAEVQLEHPSITFGSPLEDLNCSQEELQETVNGQLKHSAEAKRALIIMTSHVGGHKYAGNCIIYTPSGSGVWYGRVTPHDVESIVVNTIIKGLVLPPLLRGGLNLSRPNCKSLNDW
ncbi:Sucrase/ferredoxin-like-domain-containing protein [Cyathus striatus]|nr:Sucrase/ferredoxin-like-domain-containing protein [Cyathus striatus]